MKNIAALLLLIGATASHARTTEVQSCPLDGFLTTGEAVVQKNGYVQSAKDIIGISSDPKFEAFSKPKIYVTISVSEKDFDRITVSASFAKAYGVDVIDAGNVDPNTFGLKYACKRSDLQNYQVIAQRQKGYELGYVVGDFEIERDYDKKDPGSWNNIFQESNDLKLKIFSELSIQKAITSQDPAEIALELERTVNDALANLEKIVTTTQLKYNKISGTNLLLGYFSRGDADISVLSGDETQRYSLIAQYLLKHDTSDTQGVISGPCKIVPYKDFCAGMSESSSSISGESSKGSAEVKSISSTVSGSSKVSK